MPGIPFIKRILRRGALDAELVEAYQQTFGTPQGRKVIAHMLMEMRFFDADVQDEEGRHLRNYATRLLQRLGAGNPEAIVQEMLSGLLSIPVLRSEPEVVRYDPLNLEEDYDG